MELDLLDVLVRRLTTETFPRIDASIWRRPATEDRAVFEDVTELAEHAERMVSRTETNLHAETPDMLRFRAQQEGNDNPFVEAFTSGVTRHLFIVHRDFYVSEVRYHTTPFHELTHIALNALGIHDQLRKDYDHATAWSIEEIAADLGAVLIGRRCGISLDHLLQAHGCHLKDYLGHAKGDPRERIVMAHGFAVRAVAFLDDPPPWQLF